MSMLFTEMENETPKAYRVLARKYRPASFDDVIGQDVLVRTLTQAIESNRLAQAYMLTGVRGIGKTTTARIIARALNCIGPDGAGGPTAKPCGVCANCTAIAEDRHVDVLEMDAASRTGVDDIREIIDGVRYGPGSARFKIYIIDEVHMLSKNAFNALLKTLEEPPPHTKFIFATTEVRKVPVTVLSRCQRFDLRRVDSGLLKDHFRHIAGLEKAEAEDEALALIARAADGSVRDGLSLLDQALARSGGMVHTEDVRDMLGLADRARLVALFEAVHQGEPALALQIAAELHRLGADPLVVLQDLADITHTLARLKAAPGMDPSETPELERGLAKKFGDRLSTAGLARSWQMLLKGMQETAHAPDAAKALDMVLIRLAHAANLPDPADLVRRIESMGGAASVENAPGPPAGGGPAARASSRGSAALAVATAQPAPQTTPQARPRDEEQPVALAAAPSDFRGLVALFGEKREITLRNHLYHHVRLVRYQPGHLDVRVAEKLPPDFAGSVMRSLQQWTGLRWIVSLSQEAAGDAPLAEQDQDARKLRWQNAGAHPLVQAALARFPGAALRDVRRKPSLPASEPAAEAQDAPAFDPDTSEQEDNS